MSISGVGGMSEYDAWVLDNNEPPPHVQRIWDDATDNASRLDAAFEAAFASAALVAGIRVDCGSGPHVGVEDGDGDEPQLMWRCPHGRAAADTTAAQFAEFFTAVGAALRATA